MIVEYYDTDDLDNLISQGHWSEEMSPQWKHMRALEHDLEIELFQKSCREMGIPNRNDSENKWKIDMEIY